MVYCHLRAWSQAKVEQASLPEPLLRKAYTREATSPSLRRPKRVCFFTMSGRQLNNYSFSLLRESPLARSNLP